MWTILGAFFLLGPHQGIQYFLRKCRLPAFVIPLPPSSFKLPMPKHWRKRSETFFLHPAPTHRTKSLLQKLQVKISGTQLPFPQYACRASIPLQQSKLRSLETTISTQHSIYNEKQDVGPLHNSGAVAWRFQQGDEVIHRKRVL